MKKLFFTLIIFSTLLFIITGCEKEYSIESVDSGVAATGTLLDSLGNCGSAVVNGRYQMDTVLTDSNFVLININFSTTGKYKVSTDTVNGIWFADAGVALNTGATVLKLKGYGKPILPNGANFIVSFNNQFCSFSISAGAVLDYLPTAAGSYWSFQYTPAITVPINGVLSKLDSFMVAPLAQMVTYAGNDYYQYATSLQDIFFFRKNNGVYYEYSSLDFDYYGIFDEVIDYLDYPYLKENVPVGTTWDSDVEAVKYGGLIGAASKTGFAKITFTITQTGQNYTIAGKTLSDVITVRREVYFREDFTTPYYKIIEGSASYAKGIGLIDQNIVLPNGTIQSIPIQRWLIN